MIYSLDQGQLKVQEINQGLFLQLQPTNSAPFVMVPVTNQVENVFSASIDATTNPIPIVGSSSSSFIQSVVEVSTAQYQVNYIPDFFTETPTVELTVDGVDTYASYLNSNATGVLIRTRQATGAVIQANFNISVQRQGFDYKAPQGVYLGNIDNKRICYLKDIKPSGTAGGPSIAGSQDRDLNTIEGDSSFCQLNPATGVFTLEPGSYDIEFYAPGYKVNGHRVRLVEAVSQNLRILGSNELNAASDVAQTSSRGAGIIDVSTVFEYKIRHFTSAAKTSNGLGNQLTNAGVGELYTTVKIEKIR